MVDKPFIRIIGGLLIITHSLVNRKDVIMIKYESLTSDRRYRSYHD